MLPLLIDEKGKIWDPRSLALRLELHASIDELGLREFAILNLGFIGLLQSKGSVHIRLRPALAKPAALGTLYLWLHQHGARRIVVTWYNGRWQNEIVAWNRNGWRRMTSLLEQRETGLRRFSRTEISPDRLNLKNPLRHLLEDRSRLAEIVADPARKLPAPLNERFVVLTEDSAHELRVSDFGRTMMLRSSGWRRGARGLRVDDLPDWHYGQWVADAYRKAARSGRPMLEEISAVIEWPEHGKLSHAYWRLIVPQNAPDQPTRLLGVTLDSGVGAHELA